ncbi:MAG: hypothetical protein JWM72_4568 [Actinomycetia bacterium]|nr:hypothetical protein [Actinomycetes bacterium]MDQ1461383.1 hypothetical protein [Actinomycetota bacterium]
MGTTRRAPTPPPWSSRCAVCVDAVQQAGWEGQYGGCTQETRLDDHGRTTFGSGMFRVTYLVSDPDESRHRVGELRPPSIGGGVRIVSAFQHGKTVDVYLDVANHGAPLEAAENLARQLGVTEYEVTQVEPLSIGSAPRPTVDGGLHRADAITQVRVHPDDRTLSILARHRPHEAVERIEVEQTEDSVSITVLVATPDDHIRSPYASITNAFTWRDTVLDRPLGDRRVIRSGPSENAPMRTGQ